MRSLVCLREQGNGRIAGCVLADHDVLCSSLVNAPQLTSSNRMNSRTLCQIAQEFRGQFLLTYSPNVVDKEGAFHKIALKANKDDLRVVTREGYYAPAEK